MKLAIINCKARKSNVKCSVKQMYEPSQQFRSQKQFIEQYYDHYMVLSTKYGLVEPTDIIEPYDITLAKGQRLKQKPSLEGQELEMWKNKVIKQINDLKQKYTEIDLHISNSYLKHIKVVVDNKVKHIKQPVNPGLVINRYNEALTEYLNHKQCDLTKIGKKHISLTPEQPRTWYHNEFPPFFGTSNQLHSKYKDADAGNAWKISMGWPNWHQTGGWALDKSLLVKIKKGKNGKWRIKNER